MEMSGQLRTPTALTWGRSPSNHWVGPITGRTLWKREDVCPHWECKYESLVVEFVAQTELFFYFQNCSLDFDKTRHNWMIKSRQKHLISVCIGNLRTDINSHLNRKLQEPMSMKNSANVLSV
jgi:hypothetical protein